MSSIDRKFSVGFWWVIVIGLSLAFGPIISSCSALGFAPPSPSTETPIPPDDGIITVSVVDELQNPLTEGVVVRVTNSTQVDSSDNDMFRVVSCDSSQFISAWAPGREAAFLRCDGQSTSYQIQLRPLNGYDNAGYSWVAANGYCSNCHSGLFAAGYNELAEWSMSGHAKVFDNRHFETMYQGTSLGGYASPQTQWALANYDRVRLPPALNNYYGPGFKLDFPEQAGNCAYCHAPATIPSSQINVDLSSFFPKPAGVQGEGVTCDVCHKVLNVTLDNNGYPFVDRPGVLSFLFLRPDSSFTTGPFANILTRDFNLPLDHSLACAPVFSKSEFCAACHYGKFGNMQIYNSYGEWKQSKYGDNPAESDYMTCQDCHMSHLVPGKDNPPSSRRQACSESDPNFQNFDHNMMSFGWDENLGREIPLLVRGAAKIKMDFKYEPEKKNSLNVVVRVQNVRAGHKFPTDSPLRHLILVVDAKDQLGTPLSQSDGERIPNWGGEYRGLPGKIFANLLVEKDTNVSPTAAYWNETKLAWDGADTRLIPDEADKSEYSFPILATGEIKVTVTLIYRFAFYDLMAQKQWYDRPDIIVASTICSGNPTAPDSIKCADVELKNP